MRTTIELAQGLTTLLVGYPTARAGTGMARDAVCDAVRSLLQALDDRDAMVALRRGCHAAALGKDSAILANRPLDAALLEATVQVGCGVELLADGDDAEARSYLGAALGTLADHRVLTGVNPNEAVELVKADLRRVLSQRE